MQVRPTGVAIIPARGVHVSHMCTPASFLHRSVRACVREQFSIENKVEIFRVTHQEKRDYLKADRYTSARDTPSIAFTTLHTPSETLRCKVQTQRGTAPVKSFHYDTIAFLFTPCMCTCKQRTIWTSSAHTQLSTLCLICLRWTVADAIHKPYQAIQRGEPVT